MHQKLNFGILAIGAVLLAALGPTVPAFAATSLDDCVRAFLALRLHPGDADEEPLELKRSKLLTRSSQEMRKTVIDSGEVNTTSLRSEFKHYLTHDDAEQIVSDLKAEYPAKFDVQGNLLSGVSSRDNRVKVKEDLILSALGPEVLARVKEKKLFAIVQYPEVFEQHQAELLAGMGDPALVEKVRALQAEAVEEARHSARQTFTDTASTEKFRYRTDLSTDAIRESVASHQITGADSIFSALKDPEFRADTPAAQELIQKLIAQGNSRENAEAFLRDVEDRSYDEGVIRYRKYRMGPKGADFEGVPAPGSAVSSASQSIQDAPFASNVTWIEFKMKNTQGRDVMSTVVNKPRFPVSDVLAAQLKDPANFLDETKFKKLTDEVRESVKANLKDAYNEKELDAALNFMRELHREKLSFEPVGRTVYARESYNLNLAEGNGEVHNIQVTIDSDVRELDRSTGKMVQALPVVDRAHQWHFQFDAESGWYEQRDPATDEVARIMEPSTRRVYEVHQGVVDFAKPIEAQAMQVKVMELKVPVQFIGMSDDDVRRIPALDGIREARRSMIEGTANLNQERKLAKLRAFELDKGKRSTARKDISGGKKLRINPDGMAAAHGVVREFSFNPESGLWVSWGRDGQAQFVYQPGSGVLRIDRAEDDAKRWVITPVYYNGKPHPAAKRVESVRP